MSLPVPTSDEKIRFVEEFVIPSFDTELCNDQTSKARKQWMKGRQALKEWPVDQLFDELIIIYGSISSTVAEERLKQLHQQNTPGKLLSLQAEDEPVGKFISLLKKNGKNRPDSKTVLKIVRDERLLMLACTDADKALDVYLEVFEQASTETKSYIGTVLGLRVNGPAFEDFPFIMSARGPQGSKLVKILRIPEGATELMIRKQDIDYELQACKFIHQAIIPMEESEIDIDIETARTSSCRVGKNFVIIMPWLNSSLNKQPSGELEWIATEGAKLFLAIEYIHAQGYVHLDIKAQNVFVDHNSNWFLGDFGSCKPIGEKITSMTWRFYTENAIGKDSDVLIDWTMFLVMLMIEAMDDRRKCWDVLYPPEGSNPNSMRCVDKNLLLTQAKVYSQCNSAAFSSLICLVLAKIEKSLTI